MWFFLMVPWVSLQCVIVVFPDHTHFLVMLWMINKVDCSISWSYSLTFYQCDLYFIIDFPIK